jgi:hypothetical protein
MTCVRMHALFLYAWSLSPSLPLSLKVLRAQFERMDQRAPRDTDLYASSCACAVHSAGTSATGAAQQHAIEAHMDVAGAERRALEKVLCCRLLERAERAKVELYGGGMLAYLAVLSCHHKHTCDLAHLLLVRGLTSTILAIGRHLQGVKSLHAHAASLREENLALHLCLQEALAKLAHLRSRLRAPPIVTCSMFAREQCSIPSLAHSLPSFLYVFTRSSLFLFPCRHILMLELRYITRPSLMP